MTKIKTCLFKPGQNCDVSNSRSLIGSYGNAVVGDSALNASSEFNTQTGARFSRLNTEKVAGHNFGAWSARSHRIGEWIRVDLGEVKVIRSVTTQGRSDHTQYVSEFRVTFSVDGDAFALLTSPEGAVLNFRANSDRNTPVSNVFPVPFVARYVTIVPTKRYGWISLRWDLFGCGING